MSQTSASLTGYRMPTLSSSRCHILRGLLQASWVFLVFTGLMAGISLVNRHSFTARLCGAVTRAKAHPSQLTNVML